MISMNKKIFFSVFVSLILLSSCGGDDPVINPNPAPPPVNPAPPPPTGGVNLGAQGGRCAPVIGNVPFRTDNVPYFGNMTNVQVPGGTGTNSLELVLKYVNFTAPDKDFHNVVAEGRFSFPDLLSILGGGGTQGSVPTAYCVASADPLGSGIQMPGVFVPWDNSIAITLKSVIPVPLVYFSPFNGGYPGGVPGGGFNGGIIPPQQFGEELLEISVGNLPGCSAYLNEGRIVGCARVSIGTGNRSAPLWYELH